MSSAHSRRWLSRLWPIALAVALAGTAVAVVRSRPVVVTAAPVEAGPVAREAVGTGTIESESQVSVAFTLPGRLLQIPVQEGQRVRAGEILARLDPAPQEKHLAAAKRGVDLAAVSVQRADADIERARVTREAAERDKKRAESLFASGVLSEAERDSAVERADRSAAELSAALAARRQSTTAVSVARATADVEAERTDETTITSPVDGVVVRRVREPGDVVSAGAPVLVVASTRKVWARTWIDETVIHELREGQPARVVLRGDPSHPLAARVDRVAVEGDRQTHEVLVDLELVELPPRIVFGQRADGFIALEVVPSSIRIPQGACDVARGRCPVERGGKVAYVDVKLGLQGNDWVEVQSGLASGDVVLLPEPSSGAPPAGRRVERRAP